MSINYIEDEINEQIFRAQQYRYRVQRINDITADLAHIELPAGVHVVTMEEEQTSQRPRTNEQIATSIIIRVPSNGIVSGHIVVCVDNDTETTNYATLLCSVSNFMSYFAEIDVRNVNELVEMVQMVCDTVLEQPQLEEINLVTISNNWIIHNLIPIHLRN